MPPFLTDGTSEGVILRDDRGPGSVSRHLAKSFWGSRQIRYRWLSRLRNLRPDPQPLRVTAGGVRAARMAGASPANAPVTSPIGRARATLSGDIVGVHPLVWL